MDDFGTGYSSLSYLSRFPVDILKMDRSFLSPEHEESGLAAAIIALGNSLNLDVVAEGIEQPGADRLAPRARLRARPGLPLRQADDHEALVEYLVNGGERGRAEVACSIVTRRSTARAASPASTSSLRSATGTSACSGRG